MLEVMKKNQQGVADEEPPFPIVQPEVKSAETLEESTRNRQSTRYQSHVRIIQRFLKIGMH